MSKTIMMFNKMTFECDTDKFNKAEGKKCACRIEDTPENICPCKELKETGKCICGIFKRI